MMTRGPGAKECASPGEAAGMSRHGKVIRQWSHGDRGSLVGLRGAHV